MPSPLPEKPCARCGRPFSWRRKWARDWDQVKYCSDKCRMGKAADPAATPAPPPATPSPARPGRRGRGR